MASGEICVESVLLAFRSLIHLVKTIGVRLVGYCASEHQVYLSRQVAWVIKIGIAERDAVTRSGNRESRKQIW